MAARVPLAVTALAMGVLAACAGGRSSPVDAGAQVVEAQPVSLPRVEASPKEGGPSALEGTDQEGLPRPLVDPARIISGGPPPDGIPSIDEPKFLRSTDVRFLRESEPVLALRIGDDARAYPVQILIWHEVVNDTVGGIPVTVSYCPLCNSAIAYDRRLDDRVLEFGTSGRLYQSALVMYDRQTQSLWSHFTGQAIAGVLTSRQLHLFPVSTLSWGEWRRANPGSWVLSRDTGHPRDYGRNPYPGYDDASSHPFLFDGEVDGRLAAKARVVGIRAGTAAVAVRHEELLEREVLEVTLDRRRLVVWAKPGTASALDAASLGGGRDVGATGVFVPLARGRDLHFDPEGDGFRDRETGTTWDVSGRAIAGPLTGESLEAVEHVDTFWFAWAAFLPQTAIVP
jgi:hypothetical protein